MATRNRSQQPSFNQLANSTSPQKGFKTRVVYKNAGVEEEDQGMRSLYGQSFNRATNSRASQRSNGSVTLADIGAMHRMSASKAQLDKVKAGDLASPKGQKQMLKKLEQPGQRQETPKGYKLEKTVPVKNVASPEKKASAPEATAGLSQKMYESQLLKDAMTREFHSHPYININDDAEYYDTIKKLDYCGRCWAAQQKYYSSPFKLKHKGPGQSLYQRDYVKHPLDSQGPVLKNDFYSTFANNEPMDYGTTMRNDYKPWNVGPVKRETMNFAPATTGIPLAGKSNYKTEFVDWGANVTAYEKPIVATTIIPELPFMGKTTYRDNFAKPDPTTQLKPKDQDLWKQKSGRSPITTGIPFLGETNYAATYKPFKVGNVPNFEEKEEYEPTQALPDHLKSLYSKDFGPKPYWKCPAIIFMENNPHPRTKHLYV